MNATEFKRRFVPFYQALYRVAFTLTGNAPDAEDLLHDAYLKLWKKRDRLGEAALNARYLSAVVKNCYIDRVRSRNWRTITLEEGTATGRPMVGGSPVATDGPMAADLPESGILTESGGPPDALSLKELMRLVDKLPEREKQLLMSHILEDVSYDELSRRTGLKEGNIRQILFRTRNKLKAQWKKMTRSK